MATVPLSFLVPAYSSGDTITDSAGVLVYIALAVGIVLALIPIGVPEGTKKVAYWTCGSLLILSSFVTVLGMFFIPSGLILLSCGALAGRRSASPA